MKGQTAADEFPIFRLISYISAKIARLPALESRFLLRLNFGLILNSGLILYFLYFLYLCQIFSFNLLIFSA